MATMRTEIPKNLSWGFNLTEQELRRISQVCREQMTKISPPIVPQEKFTAKLNGGATVEASTIDQILAIENSGSKTITSLELQYGDKDRDPAWEISVVFQKGTLTPPKWTSISIMVRGQDRDWAIIAESQLEERMVQTKRVSIEYYFSRPYIIGITALIVFFLSFGALTYFSNMIILDMRKSALSELELFS